MHATGALADMATDGSHEARAHTHNIKFTCAGLRRPRPSVAAAVCVIFDDARPLNELVDELTSFQRRQEALRAEAEDLEADIAITESKIERARNLLQAEEDKRALLAAQSTRCVSQLQDVAVAIIRHNTHACNSATRACDISGMRLFAARGCWFVVNQDGVMRKEAGDFWDTIDLHAIAYEALVAFVRRPPERAVPE